MYFDDFGSLNSIISKEPKCFFCGSRGKLEIHHVFGGSLRNKSTKYGLYVFLCPKCHRELHFGKESRKMADELKSVAQSKLKTKFPKINLIKEFGGDYRKEGGIGIESIEELAEDLKKGL